MVMNAVDVEVERLLAAGKEAARTGDAAQARSYLTQVVERDPQNEQAWMWLSGVVTEPDEQQICLENVLVINPYNTKARQGLEFLSVKTGVAPHEPPAPTEFTAPLSDLSAYGHEHDATPAFQGHNAPRPVIPTDMSLPPWMQSGSSPHASAPAVAEGHPVSPAPHVGSLDPSGLPFTPPSAAPSATSNATALPNDPWGGMNVAANSLDIDWSKGLEAEPADPQHNGFGPAQFGTGDLQALGSSMDLFGQANDASNGIYNGQMPGWALDNAQGFEPLRAGSLGFGNNGDGASQTQGQAGMPGAESHGGGAYSPLGPGGDFQLPQPSDLPGYNASAQAEAKPWYAQSSQPSGMLPQHATGMLAGMDPNGDERTQHLSSVGTKPAVLVECPNCHEQVVDTALSCPQCNFGFFVNCPNCHELVDTVDAKKDVTEPCPYCGTAIEKMALGMINAGANSTYVLQKPVKMEGPVPAMQHYADAAAARRGFSWAWVVDVMWLAAVVAMIWAFTQLPAWLRLAGQY